ncbi:hypothetical protein LTR93_011330 [Exophiala xenobiotica]|nr:hypothetical protein LTR93_011330 [Exophiala xenobiotica]
MASPGPPLGGLLSSSTTSASPITTSPSPFGPPVNAVVIDDEEIDSPLSDIPNDQEDDGALEDLADNEDEEAQENPDDEEIEEAPQNATDRQDKGALDVKELETEEPKIEEEPAEQEIEEEPEEPENEDTLATAEATAEQAKKVEELAAAQASSSLAAWNTEDNFERQQTQANDDLRAAELVNYRLDGEFNREVKADHVTTLVNSFSLSGCNRTRGDLPILAMTRKDYDDCLQYTANILGEPYESVAARAKDPDAARQDKHGDGVARTIVDLVPFMLPPLMAGDQELQPEVEAGHHRFLALRQWSINRNAEGARVDAKGRLDHEATVREKVIDLFAYGCYIVDKDRLYKNIDLLRYSRANRTDSKMQNSDGDTFRSIRTAWLCLNGVSRDQIIKKADPAFPLGFPQWIAYTTGTQITAPQAQDRLKRVLTSPRFSSLADFYCRFMWGRSSYSNTCWGKLMSAGMPSWVEFWLTTHTNIHHKLFGEQCYLISDAELELLHQCFNWKELRFDQALLEELFLPIEGEDNHQNLKPPTPEEWSGVMAQCVIPENNHAGHSHRHPRFLRLLAVPDYESC